MPAAALWVSGGEFTERRAQYCNVRRQGKKQEFLLAAQSAVRWLQMRFLASFLHGSIPHTSHPAVN